jgi:hypothetical protein
VGVERIRERSVELEAVRIRLPAERERVAVALRMAEREVGDRRAALAAAEPENEQRAKDALRIAERRLRSAQDAVRRLEEEEVTAEREAAELEAMARELATALRNRPGLAEGAGKDPAAGLEGISRWATEARAALFVARGTLARQREALIRQANELGTAVLGEPLTAQSPSAVARRIERLDS